MAKSDLMAAVEQISERITKKALRDCKAFATMGTWIKTLQDENRTLKRRIEELEIRMKKLNTHGPTPVKPQKRTNSSDDIVQSVPAESKTPVRLTRAQMQKIRTSRGFSQTQFALLLGVSPFRYTKWENGRTTMPVEFEQKIRAIREMKATDLRTHMQNAGIFQPNGKPQTSSAPSATVTQNREFPLPQTQKAELISVKELKAIRAALGLTQQEFAEKLKIKKTRYKNWEQGIVKVPVEFSAKIRKLSTQKIKTETSGSAVKPASEVIAKPKTLSAVQLQKIRISLGLTKNEMAEALGIKRNRYSNWEYNVSKAAPEFVEKMLKLQEEKQKMISSPASGKSRKAPQPSLKWQSDVDGMVGKKLADLLNTNPVPSYLSAVQLREIRSVLNLTQQQFAKFLKIREERYANWERGYRNISPEFVKKIIILLAKNDRRTVDSSKSAGKQSIVEAAVLTPKSIQKIRADLGLTQPQIAAKLGVNTTRYAHWEQGNVKLPAEFSRKIHDLASKTLRMTQKTNTGAKRGAVK